MINVYMPHQAVFLVFYSYSDFTIAPGPAVPSHKLTLFHAAEGVYIVTPPEVPPLSWTSALGNPSIAAAVPYPPADPAFSREAATGVRGRMLAVKNDRAFAGSLGSSTSTALSTTLLQKRSNFPPPLQTKITINILCRSRSRRGQTRPCDFARVNSIF